MPTREEGQAAVQPEAARHLYEGEPDARQDTSGQRGAAVGGLFRKRYGKIEPYEIESQDAIKDKANELAYLIGRLNPGVYGRLLDLPLGSPDVPPTLALGKTYDAAGVTLALRHLEDAVYRAVKALTA